MNPGRAPAVAVGVALTWTLPLLLGPFEPDAWNPRSLVDYLATLSWSLSLISIGPAAWIVASLAIPGRATVTAAAITALGGLIAGVANVFEDGLGFKAIGGNVYVAGIGVLLLGIIGLAVVTSARRRWAAAAITIGTFVGVGASANGGAWIMPILWFSVGVWLYRSRAQK